VRRLDHAHRDVGLPSQQIVDGIGPSRPLCAALVAYIVSNDSSCDRLRCQPTQARPCPPGPASGTRHRDRNRARTRKHAMHNSKPRLSPWRMGGSHDSAATRLISVYPAGG
jgi:hypothetical protein